MKLPTTFVAEVLGSVEGELLPSHSVVGWDGGTVVGGEECTHGWVCGYVGVWMCVGACVVTVVAGSR